MKKTLAALAALTLVVILAPLATMAAHHLFPLSWTGEAGRLAQLLSATEGSQIAEIGAGHGAMAREIARHVGPQGRLFVTEIAPDKRQRLAQLAEDERIPQIVVVAGTERGTNLPSGCCSAIYLRNVLHHIEDWESYAKDLIRTLRPDGLIAVIDFKPGALFHLADDHGASADRVAEAFTNAGLSLEQRDDDWGGATYLLVFRRVQ